MNKILFKCRIKSTKEWVYWNPFGRIVTIEFSDSSYNHDGKCFELISEIHELLDLETAAKSIGFIDKTGKAIFVGDSVDIYTYRYYGVDNTYSGKVIIDDYLVLSLFNENGLNAASENNIAAFCEIRGGCLTEYEIMEELHEHKKESSDSNIEKEEY